ncbi:hypothetical protein, partial, partial [Parasitella parasitica]
MQLNEQQLFTPIIPISYHGQVSQKNKDINIPYFVSRFIGQIIPLFTKVSRTNNLQSINFKELDVLIKHLSDYVYFGDLLGISADIEERAEQKIQFIFNIYSQTATKKDISFSKIGQGGLSGDIKKTNDALDYVVAKKYSNYYLWTTTIFTTTDIHKAFEKPLLEAIGACNDPFHVSQRTQMPSLPEMCAA